MNILLLGSGGREHALAWKISQSPLADKLYIAPGNAGTEEPGVNLNIDILNYKELKDQILDKHIGLVVIGPEAPLVEGIADLLNEDSDLSDILVIGPGKKGAKLEGSKDYAKDFMYKYSIPTAAYRTFSASELEEGKQYLRKLKPPYVLKADGLAAGKGVMITHTMDEAEKELEAMLQGKFGKAGEKVVIEEFLEGIELSVFVLTDGESYVILPEAKDYKRIGEGDTGLNTGGMGAVSPVAFAHEGFLEKVEKQIVIPTIEGLKKENIPYKGFIFIGLMNSGGEPRVIEYNVRLGDPETEVILPRIESDFTDLMIATARGKLNEKEVIITKKTVVTVMLVSGGYPGTYEKGKEINGFSEVSNSLLFHAGTKKEGQRILTNGGRVLAISSAGNDMAEALEKSYENAKRISFEGKYYRRDIGFDLEN